MLIGQQTVVRPPIMMDWRYFAIAADAAVKSAASEFGLAEEALRAAFGRQGKPDRPLAMVPAKLAVYRAISEAMRLPLANLPENLGDGRCPAAAYWHRHGEASLGDLYEQKFPQVKAAVVAALEAAA